MKAQYKNTPTLAKKVGLNRKYQFDLPAQKNVETLTV